MNKNLLLIGGLLVAGAVGAFLFLKKPALPGAPALVPGGQETVSASFADLVKMGKDYSCTFTTVDETTGAETNGLVYVADQGNKLNGEFVQQTDGVAMKTNIIRDGEYTYLWSAADMKGYKMKIDPNEESVWESTESQEGFDPEQPVDFTCAPWTPQGALFTPPAEIQFMDMSAQMEVMQEQMNAMPTSAGTGNAQYCGACAQLEGQAQAQCLTAMGC